MPKCWAAAVSSVVAAVILSSSVALGDVPINVRQIVRQVVPRDAIPALSRPRYDTLDAATYMHDRERLLTLRFAGEDLAFPTRILDHHEIVNDVVNGHPLTVTY